MYQNRKTETKKKFGKTQDNTIKNQNKTGKQGPCGP